MKICGHELRGLEDLQDYVGELYGDINGTRPWDYLFGYLVRSCGFMTVNARAGKALPIHYVRALSWILAIAQKHEFNLTQAYLRRFPGKCYYCISDPCVCFRTNKQPHSNIPAWKAEEEREGYYQTISHQIEFKKIAIDYKWLALNVAKVYPNNEIIWYHSGPSFHFTRLMEELGELHQALSNYEASLAPINRVEEEAADVLAWILAIWPLAIPGKDLQDEFISYYYRGCPVCQSKPCICLARAERKSGIAIRQDLETLEKQVNKLSEVMQDTSSDFNDLRKSLRIAIETGNEQIAYQAVSETQNKMEAIKNTIDSADDTGKKALSLIGTVLALSSKLSILVELFK